MVSGAVVDALLFWARGGSPPRGFAGPLTAGAVLIAVILYGMVRLAEDDFQPGPTICLMGKQDTPASIDPNQIASKTERRPDLFLWPELSLQMSLIDIPQTEAHASWPPLPLDVATQTGQNLVDHAESIRHDLAIVAHNLDATLLIGCERFEPGPKVWRRYNSVACIDPQQGLVGYYDKCYPVPWAEFMPYATDRVGSEDEDNFRRGVAPAQFDIRIRAGGAVARCRPALCYDLCFASFFRAKPEGEASRHGVDFFVHSGSEGQDRTGVLAETMLRAARFRAVESRRAIVRNVSQGTSGILNSNGQLQVVLMGTVPIDSRWSFYTYAGDWPMVLMCVLFAIRGKIRARRASE